MSSLSTRSRLRRRIATSAAVVAAAAASGAVVAPSADAAFTLQPCGGSNIQGQGGSFQAAAQGYFNQLFQGSSDGCGGTPQVQAYTSSSSGDGLAAMGAGGGDTNLLCLKAGTCSPADPVKGGLPAGVRDATSPFSTSDDPPSPTQQASMNAGTSSATDDGTIHVIPALTGAATFIVNLPAGCSLPTDGTVTGGSDGTGDSTTNLTARPKVPSATVEAAWAGEAQTWGDMVPGITGTPTSSQESGISTCAAVPIKRIVRPGNSGTTYGFKAYLALINGARFGAPALAGGNTTWPTAGGGTGTPVTKTSATDICLNTDANRLCANNGSTGAGGLRDLVTNTDGAIGYVDLATARGTYTVTPAAAGGTQDRTFWLPLQILAGPNAGKYAEPTADPTGNLSTTTNRGAACSSVAVQNAPTPANSPNQDPTQGDWSKAAAAGGNGYPNCVISYILAWDDNAPIYGNTQAEEARARTVKDFLTLVTGAGQSSLLPQDYSPVPNSSSQTLLTYARNAVAAINWNKTGGGGSTPPPTDTTPGTTPPPADTTPVDDTPPADTTPSDTPPAQTTPSTTTPVVVPTTPVVVPTTPVATPVPSGTPTATPVSSSFTFSSAKASGSTAARLALTFPRAGRASVRATARVGGKTVTVGTATKSVSKSGRTTVTLRLTSRGRSAVRRAGRKGLSVSVKVTFRATGATSSASRAKKVRIRR